jgi:hypothetical protein
LVGVLEDELLELSGLPLPLVEDALVMDGSSSSLDRHVRTEVEVELEWVSAASLHQGSRERVAVTVTLAGLREEADMMALASNDYSELGHLLATLALEGLLHVADLFLEDSSVLT